MSKTLLIAEKPSVGQDLARVLKGPFKKHTHISHDEIGIVLSGSGTVTVGGVTHKVTVGDLWIIPANIPHSGEFTEPTNVLFISSPQDHPVHQDRVWMD